MDFRITKYDPEFWDAVADLQRKYIEVNPQGTKFTPGEYYASDVENVFCAWDGGGKLLGYGVVHPHPADHSAAGEVPHTLWIAIRCLPDLGPDLGPEIGHRSEVQDRLFDAIIERARFYQEAWTDRDIRIAISYPEARRDEIDYFLAKGFKESGYILQMGRDLSQPIDEAPIPEGVQIRNWLIQTEEERHKYLDAINLCFPHAQTTENNLAGMLDSWQGGTLVGAFGPEGEIIGGVMAYWIAEGFGLTEEVFVHPSWRRRGIARYLITQGMHYLREHRRYWAVLEVLASNEPAVKLYRSLGYDVSNREVQAGMVLSTVGLHPL